MGAWDPVPAALSTLKSPSARRIGGLANSTAVVNAAEERRNFFVAGNQTSIPRRRSVT